jgi:phosphoglycerol transferase MdoB-like AlkP superfamily enzyme
MVAVSVILGIIGTIIILMIVIRAFRNPDPMTPGRVALIVLCILALVLVWGAAFGFSGTYTPTPNPLKGGTPALP